MHMAQPGPLRALAARYYGVGDVRVEEIETPAPTAGEVRLEVGYAGICGSDLHEYFSAQTFTPVEPHPLTGQRLPVVLGHEFSGTVVDVGAGVTRVAAGDRVTVRPTYSCGECESCRRGSPNSCDVIAFHGLSATGGGMSTYTTLPAELVFRLPDEVSLQAGALVEPMAVSFHASRIGVGERTRTAYVAGAGPIGLGAVVALLAAGVEQVVVGDPSAERRRRAERLGVATLDPSATDLSDAFGGHAIDLVLDAAGVGGVVETGIAALGSRGRLVVLGIHERPMSFDPTSLLYRETAILGSGTYWDEDYSEVIELMARGAYPIDEWVEVRALDELVASMHELREGRHAKVLLDPSWTARPHTSGDSSDQRLPVHTP
jgi:(R,R)-butanediol dehydrogenase / meso-butanediol dehydrogenase / diacetyl reductase